MNEKLTRTKSCPSLLDLQQSNNSKGKRVVKRKEPIVVPKEKPPRQRRNYKKGILGVGSSSSGITSTYDDDRMRMMSNFQNMNNNNNNMVVAMKMLCNNEMMLPFPPSQTAPFESNFSSPSTCTGFLLDSVRVESESKFRRNDQIINGSSSSTNRHHQFSTTPTTNSSMSSASPFSSRFTANNEVFDRRKNMHVFGNNNIPVPDDQRRQQLLSHTHPPTQTTTTLPFHQMPSPVLPSSTQTTPFHQYYSKTPFHQYSSETMPPSVLTSTQTTPFHQSMPPNYNNSTQRVPPFHQSMRAPIPPPPPQTAEPSEEMSLLDRLLAEADLELSRCSTDRNREFGTTSSPAAFSFATPQSTLANNDEAFDHYKSNSNSNMGTVHNQQLGLPSTQTMTQYFRPTVLPTSSPSSEYSGLIDSVVAESKARAENRFIHNNNNNNNNDDDEDLFANNNTCYSFPSSFPSLSDNSSMFENDLDMIVAESGARFKRTENNNNNNSNNNSSPTFASQNQSFTTDYHQQLQQPTNPEYTTFNHSTRSQFSSEPSSIFNDLAPLSEMEFCNLPSFDTNNNNINGITDSTITQPKFDDTFAFHHGSNTSFGTKVENPFTERILMPDSNATGGLEVKKKRKLRSAKASSSTSNDKGKSVGQSNYASLTGEEDLDHLVDSFWNSLKGSMGRS